ncbi:MAG: hypothetical protein K5657_05245 [Desulfovibrio sp.]|nr:hypothetical protein [Desulfovibrio sp.]
MPSMVDHMRSLATITGWSALTTPDGAGVYRVSLDDDLDAIFFPLGGKKCIMYGVVAELPESEIEAESLCSAAARKQLAVLRERPSILAFEEAGSSPVPGEAKTALSRLVCFRSIPLDNSSEVFTDAVQDWLNDLAWWKKVLGSAESGNEVAGSPFSLKMFSGLKM